MDHPTVQILEADIVQAIQQGSEAAYEQVFRLYYERLCNYANTLVRDMDEAEEVVQSMFLKLWEKREALAISSSLKSYLYRAVHNTCLNRVKHEQVKREYASQNAGQLQQNFSQASDLAIQNELEGRIAEAIEGLPEQCRAVFKLSRFEDLKYSEIAEHLGISVKTVENQMGKALRVLRAQLADYLAIWLVLWLNWPD
jgi:RNA polymerase sigma-70 factor, ECF subfamily